MITPYIKYKEEYIIKKKKELLLQRYRYMNNLYYEDQRLQSDWYTPPIVLDPLHLPRVRLPILGLPPPLPSPSQLPVLTPYSDYIENNSNNSNYPYNGFYIPNNNSSAYDIWW